jgi:hypothetical protein
MYEIGIHLNTANPKYKASLMRNVGGDGYDVAVADAATGKALTGPVGHRYPSVQEAMRECRKWDPEPDVTPDPVLLTWPEPPYHLKGATTASREASASSFGPTRR